MLKKITLSAALAGAALLGACEAASETSVKSAVATTAAAAPAAVSTDLNIDAVRAKFPAVNPEAINESPVAGWYEIDSGGQILYVSGDGTYALRGDLINLETRVNLTDLRRNTARKSLLGDLNNDDMIVYSPDEVKHSVTVFTDIDCGYCRKLHQEMDQYHRQGIEVRYMFFPRSGPNTPSWDKATNVWCSDDRNGALTQAKANQPVSSQQCDANLINVHYETGRKVGLRGTPAIITDSGELIAGYVPAASLITRLEQAAK